MNWLPEKGKIRHRSLASFCGMMSFQVWQFINLRPTSSHSLPSLFLSLCAAINLLGLTWQLQPSDGPVLNNGMGAGLPVNSDVAPLPSGGRGMNCRTHIPLSKPKWCTLRYYWNELKTSIEDEARTINVFFPLLSKNSTKKTPASNDSPTSKYCLYVKNILCRGSNHSAPELQSKLYLIVS